METVKHVSVGEELSNSNLLHKLWISVQAIVYWDTHTPWMAPLKSTKPNVKAFAIHPKVKHYTTTCSSTQRSWLHIQYIHQSDIHLGI